MKKVWKYSDFCEECGHLKIIHGGPGCAHSRIGKHKDERCDCYLSQQG